MASASIQQLIANAERSIDRLMVTVGKLRDGTIKSTITTADGTVDDSQSTVDLLEQSIAAHQAFITAMREKGLA